MDLTVDITFKVLPSGTHIYVLEDSKIVSLEIRDINVDYQDIWGRAPKLSIKYTCIGAEMPKIYYHRDLNTKFFLSKTDILKLIADQI